MDLPLAPHYYDAAWYAGAAMVAYNLADIGVCKGFIRGDGRVKELLVGASMSFLMRALWVVGRRERIDWDNEVYYWLNIFCGSFALVAINACLAYLTRRERARARARAPVPVPPPPPPPPARQPGRRGRGGRRG